MVIKALAENTTLSEELGCEHGLSLYIETESHKILFDMGKSSLFLENAKKLNVDIKEIDIAFISHGHNDHGGGLNLFLEQNEKALIYVNDKAFGQYYAKRPGDRMDFIGLDDNLKNCKRVILAGGYLKIDEGLELYSSVSGKELCSQANKVLFMENKGEISEDNFCHEQNLIITEKGKAVLVAGCAHRGIVNIAKQYIMLKGRPADYVIGGFHLYNPGTHRTEDRKLIEDIADVLIDTGSKYYTCHCTGKEAFSILKEIMKERIEYLATGGVINI